MKRILYGLLITTIALLVLSRTVLAGDSCPTSTPIPPVDTPVPPIETRVSDTETPAPTSTKPLPTLPPTPTEEISITPESDPMPTETNIPNRPKHKITPTPELLPQTGFFDENPFAPLIALAVFCASVFGVVGFIRRKR